VFALNAPYNGGTHLPDITVVTPVFSDSPSPVSLRETVLSPKGRDENSAPFASPPRGEGGLRSKPGEGESKEPEILFWAASRGHHADVGGTAPGSMTPLATTVDEEGVLIDNFRIVSGPH
jgi:5-oxoprolinase (ATP-hydrolysing)